MLALRTRPPYLLAIALGLGTLSPLQHEAPSQPPVEIDVSLGTLSPLRPDRTLPDAHPWPHGMVIAPQIADAMAIRPNQSADASDWPHGMVIGRRDTVLSALFGPLAETLIAPAPALL